jgi:hypothetical protein
VPPV